jgi:heme exporter protein A
MALLEAVELTCHRGDRTLFEGMSFRVQEGEVLQVHGPNGGGKTTLLRILCGLTLPTSGQVLWREHEVTRGTWSDTAEFRAQTCFLGHTNGVKAELTPIENLRVWQALYETPSEDALEAAIEDVGLGGFEESLTLTLSAGQRRRIALARLLVSNAALWVLDEPFTSLDAQAVKWVESRVAAHADAGGTVILTSHQLANLDTPVSRLTLS